MVAKFSPLAFSLGAALLFASPNVARSAQFQDVLDGVCEGTSLTCRINFAVVADGKRLTVTDVSCKVKFDGVSDGGVAVSAFELRVIKTDGTVGMTVYLDEPSLLNGSNTTTFNYQGNDQVLIFANQGQKIQSVISATKGDVLDLDCSIGGDLSTFP